MINIKEIVNKDEKAKITLDIMRALPLWFSPPDDIDRKAEIHRDYPFYAAFDDEQVIGFTAIKIQTEYAADVYNIGVLEKYHRQGIGHGLIQSCVEFCIRNHYEYLIVKTLDSSAVYEPYDRTRAFYTKEGFIPLEVIPNYWNKENPCLFMVKKISADEYDI